MDLNANIDAYLAGDRDAYQAVHDAYKDCLWAFLAHRTRSREDTKDVFNWVSFEVSRLLPTLNDSRKLRSWVCAIAERRLKNYYRKRGPGETPIESVGELADRREGPEERVDRLQRLRLLRELMLALPEPQRAIAVAFYLGKVPLKDIAHFQDMPLNTVKSHLRRAKLAIMERMEEGRHARTHVS